MAKEQNDPNETKEERIARESKEARWAELRERASRSAIWARPVDKSRYVKWVRRNDDADIATHEMHGFEIAREPDPTAPRGKRIINATLNPQPDGTYVHGDVILMIGRRDDYDFHFNERVALSREKLEGSKDRFMNEAARHGVTAFKRNDKGELVVGR